MSDQTALKHLRTKIELWSRSFLYRFREGTVEHCGKV